MLIQPLATKPTSIHEQQPCAQCQLNGSSICGALAQESLEHLAQERVRQFTAPAKRVLIREGDNPNEVYRLVSGWAARLKVLADGGRQIFSFMLPGDVLSLELRPDEPTRFSIVAMTDVTLCTFSKQKISEQMSVNSALLAASSEWWATKVLDLEHSVTYLGRMSATSRIASLILLFHRRLAARGLAEGLEFDLPLRHEDLADALGITAPHFSRTLATMRDERLMELSHGRAIIRNHEALVTLST